MMEEDDYEDLTPDQMIANKNHPIWKILAGLVAILTALWVNNGGVN